MKLLKFPEYYIHGSFYDTEFQIHISSDASSKFNALTCLLVFDTDTVQNLTETYTRMADDTDDIWTALFLLADEIIKIAAEKRSHKIPFSIKLV